jgi:adenine/guanine phosphoribosyltransferase-like PRPP-binding protein
MKFLKLESELEIPYPVGIDMKLTIEIVKDMANKLNYLYDEKHSLQIFVKGSSGAILGGIISTMLIAENIFISHIKKDGENSHNSRVSILQGRDFKVIILDDFMSSGATINSIYDKIHLLSSDTVIDCLCLSGGVDVRRLDFKPRNLISARNY